MDIALLAYSAYMVGIYGWVNWVRPRRRRREERIIASWPARQGQLFRGEVRPTLWARVAVKLRYSYEASGIQAGEYEFPVAGEAEAKHLLEVLRGQDLPVRVNPADSARSGLLWADLQSELDRGPAFVSRARVINASLARTTLWWSALGLGLAALLLATGWSSTDWSWSAFIFGVAAGGALLIFFPYSFLMSELTASAPHAGLRSAWRLVPAWQRAAVTAMLVWALGSLGYLTLQLHGMAKSHEIPDLFFYRWLGPLLVWAYARSLAVALQGAKRARAPVAAAG